MAGQRRNRNRDRVSRESRFSRLEPSPKRPVTSKRAGVIHAGASLLTFIIAQGASANVVGSDVQNFNPVPDGLDFVTVQSSRTLKSGVMNFGAFGNYAADTLPIYGGQSSSYSDHVWGATLNFAVGILDNWEIGVSLPSVLQSSFNDATGAGLSFAHTGFTEVDLDTKYRFFGDDVQGFAAVLSTNFGLIENDPFTGSPSHPGLNLEAVYDRQFGPVRWALNAGFRWRNPGDPIPNVPILPVGNQLIASTAANYLIKPLDTKVVAEVYGATPAEHSNDPNARQLSSLESLLGFKHDFSENLAGDAGVGRELVNGIASPEFRVYFGLNYAIGPIFGDNKPRLEQVTGKGPEPVDTAALAEPAPDESMASGGATNERERPAPAPEGMEVKDGDHFIARNLHFRFNSTELEGDSKDVLDQLVAYLKAKPYRRLVIEGHTDSIGKASYNQALSEFRAQAIRDQLITEYHLNPRTISAIGYGASRPIADNGNYQGRLKNRRVEFKILR